MNLLVIGLGLGIAFLFQSILGFFQIRNFSKIFHEMSKQGKVLIGKNPKKIQSGSIILLNIDDSGKIYDGQLMKGYSVFAKFRHFTKLNGKSLPEVAASYDELNNFDKLTKECILNAYRNFINFKTGKMSRSDYDTSVNFLDMPTFRLWKNNIVLWINDLKKKLSFNK
ncbi:transcriptional regulator GutM [Lactobacillus corticis]|uniref:Transcriptional regulator n=1 Tax=Lactobacillus corticis TaxID=2201249 RepID=A0A916QJF9_9LACO|nr:transcriptional regulator GutM [Lactobacillus corticis]GFZ27412.1 transcriptional regulator [Lactobacillus corticis]